MSALDKLADWSRSEEARQFAEDCCRAMTIYGGNVIVRMASEGAEFIDPADFYINPPPHDTPPRLANKA